MPAPSVPAASSGPHVRALDLTRRFATPGGDLTALDGVTFDVAWGEFLCILGPSGCGKSTLLRLVAGLQEPTLGQVAIAGEPPREAQARKELGLVLQDPSLLSWRTVLGNIRLPLEVNARLAAPSAATLDGLLDLVGLRDFRDYYPHQLSGGMRQRVALARALAHRPSLLLMDEPFGALDEITREAMRYELLRLWEADRKTVLFVTHSIPEAVLLADRVLVLTSRPGEVRAVVPIELPRPRVEGVEWDDAFRSYARLLRDLLHRGAREPHHV